MKLLVTGGDGLVGSHFIENYPALDNNAIVLSPTSEELNIVDQTSVKNFFKINNPNAIIHFAAFTDVSKAEAERNNKKALCWSINVEGTANLVRAMVNHQTYFIYISTDVVFSGLKENPGPYSENHPTEENSELLSWYGWTKREAEKLIVNNLANSAILRISNPVRAKYNKRLDYTRKILNQFDTAKLYPMFEDQYLTLTYINEVTKTLKLLLKKRLNGIYHVSSSNIFTPYKLAGLLIELARGEKNAVKPISIERFLKENPSRYPQYGGLKVAKTQSRLNLKFMSWEKIVATLAKQL